MAGRITPVGLLVPKQPQSTLLSFKAKFCTIQYAKAKGKLTMPRTLDFPINRCRPSEDIVPFSECRNNLSTYITRVRETRRPILITQNGRAASYLVDAELLDNLFDQMELTRDIEISRREFAEGKGIPHEEVMRNIDNLLESWKREEAIA
ncbi:MAG: type II toxin-antitoxin system Phd/YefM family antitoxin [Kiritimatiellae bacterium]|nr:type II toxin-antitoxin system Phd/YefM family antitoxin [Kiritimatiellia bacterium]